MKLETEVEKEKETKSCRHVAYVAKHGGDAFEVSRQTGLKLREILDFSLNANPFGPPKAVFEAIKSVKDEIKCYPSRSYKELRDSIASYLRSFDGYKFSEGGGKANTDGDNIVLGCGSTELIHSFLARFVRGGTVVIPLPTFSEYEAAASAYGIKCLKVSPKGLAADLELVKDHIKSGDVDCAIICNPNNPTGELFCTGSMMELLDAAKDSGAYVMVDEAYLDLSTVGSCESLLPLVEDYERLLILRSLTKPFGFPGIRVGYAVCGHRLAGAFEASEMSWRVGAVEAAAVQAALGAKGFLEDSRSKILSEKPRLTKKISGIQGLRVEKSDANFVLVDISATGFSPGNLKWRLLAYGVLVRELSGMQGLDGEYIRVCVRGKRENANLVRSLRNVITSAGKVGSPSAQEECGSKTRSCHFAGQDCRLCFCPFYPCLDALTGGKFFNSVKGGKVWGCTDCLWIHNSESVTRVLGEFGNQRINVLKSSPGEILGVRKKVIGA